MKQFFNNPFYMLALCLSLGMAPFTPEPHLFGKIRWVMGGADGMQFMDYLDLGLHALPFILLVRVLYIKFAKQ